MSVSGMPGQAPGSKQGSLSNSGKEIAVAIIRRKVEGMLSVGDKSATKSMTVWGRLLILLSGLVLLIGQVFVGQAEWADTFSWMRTNGAEIVSILVGIFGGLLEGIGQRRAIGKSGPAINQQ